MIGLLPGIASSQRVLANATENPSIIDTGFRLAGTFPNLYQQYYWKVQNNDADTVTIYTRAGSNSFSAISVASGGETSEQVYSTSSGPVTIQAYAIADGKTQSETVSVTLS